jgi:nicotinate-nucleotide adenylyltransferase
MPGVKWASDNPMKQGFPIAAKGMVVGLLGGSFDPAHEGHVHITREALKRMGLDQVWWLVTPGNPLKVRQPAPLADRLARARVVMRHPRVRITALEVAFGSRTTADTIDRLRAVYPGVTFVWLMGADNLVQFHRWGRWRDILRSVAVGVLARPGSGVAARLSVAARAFRVHRISRGENLRGRTPPVWCFVNLPLNAASSSEIRAKGGWRPDRGQEATTPEHQPHGQGPG